LLDLISPVHCMISKVCLRFAFQTLNLGRRTSYLGRFLPIRIQLLNVENRHSRKGSNHSHKKATPKDGPRCTLPRYDGSLTVLVAGAAVRARPGEPFKSSAQESLPGSGARRRRCGRPLVTGWAIQLGPYLLYIRHPVGRHGERPVYVRVRGLSRRSVDTRNRPGDDYCTSGFGQKEIFSAIKNSGRSRCLW
jgi:hypothetical protein